MDQWNLIDIPPPPQLTLEYSLEESNLDNVVKGLTSILNSLEKSSFQGYVQKYFWLEIGVLNGFLVRFEKFRSEKFYSLLKKITKCADRLKAMEIREYLLKIHDMMPYIVSGMIGSIHIPSRRMFEYLLVKMFGAFRVFLTIDKVCVEATRHLVAKINLGRTHFHCLFVLAAVARVRALALDYAGQLASKFDAILPWLPYLKDGSKKTLINTTPCLKNELIVHCNSSGEEPQLKFSRKVQLCDNELNALDTLFGGLEKPKISADNTKFADQKSSKSLKEEDHLLSLLDIFDDGDDNCIKEINNIGMNILKDRSKDTPSCSGISAPLTLDEDVGQMVRGDVRDMTLKPTKKKMKTTKKPKVAESKKPNIMKVSGCKDDDLGEAVENYEKGLPMKPVKMKKKKTFEVNSKKTQANKSMKASGGNSSEMVCSIQETVEKDEKKVVIKPIKKKLDKHLHKAKSKMRKESVNIKTNGEVSSDCEVLGRDIGEAVQNMEETLIPIKNMDKAKNIKKKRTVEKIKSKKIQLHTLDANGNGILVLEKPDGDVGKSERNHKSKMMKEVIERKKVNDGSSRTKKRKLSVNMDKDGVNSAVSKKRKILNGSKPITKKSHKLKNKNMKVR